MEPEQKDSLSRRRFLKVAAGSTAALTGAPLIAKYAWAKDEIRLGAICALSGPASTIGSQQAIGIRMAVDHINKAGGVDGRPIKLFLEDDETKVPVGLAKAQKLVQANRVHAMTGIIYSSISMAIQQFINREAKIPFVNSGSGNPAVSAPPHCGKYTFQATPSSSLLALAAGYAAKKHGFRWAFIADDYGWGRLSVKLMKEAVALNGKIEVVGEEYAPFGTTNYAPYITKATAGHPDCVGIATFGSGYAPVLLQLHQMGVKAHRHHIFWSRADANAAGEACLGMTTGGSYVFSDPNVPQSLQWAKAYYAIHKKWPDPAAAFGYIGVMVLAESIRKAKGTDPDAMVHALESTPFNSIEGHVHFRDCDHMLVTPVNVLEAKHSPTYDYYASYVETVKHPDALLVPCGKTGCEALTHPSA